MARPTKYNEDVLKQTEEYLESGYETLPNMAGLASYLDVTKKTLYNWSEEHPEFLHSLGKLLQKQENMLLEKGLKGEYNSTITKLVLHNHGYSDKQDLTTQGDKIQSGVVILPSKDES